MDSQMTIGKKLTLVGGLLIACTIALGAFTLIGLGSYDSLVQSLATGSTRAAAVDALATGARLKWLTWVVMLCSVGLGSGVLFLFVCSLTRVLRQTVSELTEGTGQVACASAQVASSSQALAQGSSEQAASLEETSASSEEITSMTRKNAENSATAATLMTDVDQRVKEGNQTLEEMMQ